MIKRSTLLVFGLLLSTAMHTAADVVFSDDFDNGSGNWSQTSGSGTIDISNTVYNSASNGLRIGGRASTFDTSSIDTTTSGVLLSVEIGVWIQRGSDDLPGSENPDSGEDFQFQYRNSSGTWVTLETFSGGGTPGEIYTRTYTLAADASHTGFRLGLWLDGGTNRYDYWHIDDVSVEVKTLPPGMDHFAISHSGAGQTCVPQTVTVAAHDAVDGIYTDFFGLVTLTATATDSASNVGTWTLLSGSNPGSFADLGNGQAQYQYVIGDSGIATFGYTHDNADTIDFDVSSGSYSESAAEDPELDLADAVSSQGNVRDEFGANPGSFRDYFSSASYDNNDGALSWSGSWIENDYSGGGAASGDVRISGGQLELTGNNISGSGFVQASAEREIDLSTYTQAVLRFRMRSSSVESDDNITVAVSSDGGSTWTQLTRVYNDLDQYRPYSFDISSYISGNTRIRFRIEDESGSSCCYGPSDEILEIDDVEVLVNGSGLYSNNDGSLSWLGAWQESDGDGPLFGEVSIYNDALLMHGSSGSVVSVSRMADLSGVSSATLTFDYQPTGNVDSADEFLVQASSGTSGWTTLHTVSGSSAGSASIDLGAFLAADAQIRFVIDDPGSSGSCCYDNTDEYVVLDNIDIEVFQAESCASCTLGAFAITQPAYALACPLSRSPVQIEAMCQDGVTVKDDFSGTINLATSENGLSELYQSASGGNQINALVFDGSESGVQDVYLFHKNENNNLLVTATDASTSISATASTGTDVRTSGFSITGESNFQCGATNTLTVTAIGQSDNNSGSCSVLTGFGGTKAMKAWFTVNTDPLESPGVADSVSQPMVINGASIADSELPDSSNLSLNFTNGVAQAELAYQDVGEVLAVNLRHDEAPYDGSVAALGRNPQLTGSASTFIVYPEKVAVTVNSAAAVCSPASANCSAFTAAGANFAVALEAQCTGGAVAASYQGGITMAHVLQLPSGGQSGSLGVTSASITDADNGAITVSNQSISEVGVFDITAAPETYFGQTVIGSTAANVGRFYPADFNVSVESDGTFANACSGNFSYTGQSFAYLSTPQLRIVPVNTSAVPTQNYIGNFDRLGTVTINVPLQDSSQFGNDGSTLMQISAALSAGTFADDSTNAWEKIYTLNAADSFSYNKDSNARIDAFSTDIDLVVALVTDGDASASGLPTIEPVSNQIRYGRLRLENTFGSELEDLMMPVKAEYWNGSRWLLNSADECTTLHAGATSLASYTDNLNAGETDAEVDGSSSGSATLVDGSSYLLTLTAPGLNNEGSVVLAIDASQLDDWLEFDWDSDPSTDNTPSASAQFGHYRGHDRIIYWREVTN